MQMQAMMSSMGNMDPGLMQRQMEMMKNMSPADMQRMQQEVGRMDPATLASQAEQANKMLSAQQKYILDVSPVGRCTTPECLLGVAATMALLSVCSCCPQRGPVEWARVQHASAPTCCSTAGVW